MSDFVESDVFTAAPAPGDIDTEMLIIILVAFVFLIALALLLLCLCRTRARDRPANVSMLVTDPAPSGNSVESLIPPLFYTEDLRDPLMQEDLRDRVIALRGTGPIRIS
jgi:hypothetical protein